MPLESVRSGSLAGSSPAPNQQISSSSVQVESRRQEQIINQDVKPNQENFREEDEKISSKSLQENSNNAAINESPKKRGRPRKDPNATPSPPRKRQPKKEVFQNLEAVPDSTTTKDSKDFKFGFSKDGQFVVNLPPMNSFPNCSWNFESQSMSPSTTKMIPNIYSSTYSQGWQGQHIPQAQFNQIQTQPPVNTKPNESFYVRNEAKQNPMTTTRQQFYDAMKQEKNQAQVQNCPNVQRISSQSNPELYDVLPKMEPFKPKTEAPDLQEMTSFKVEPKDSHFQQDPNPKLEVKVEKREPLIPLENLISESIRKNDKEVPPDCTCLQQDQNRRRKFKFHFVENFKFKLFC